MTEEEYYFVTISDLVTVKPKSSYDLRSHSSLLLEPPKEKMLSTCTLGARSFYAAAPCLWNSLRLSCVIFNHYVVLTET